MTDYIDPREAARAVLGFIQKNEPIHSTGTDVFAAPYLEFSMASLACATARYHHALGPDESDNDGEVAYSYVAGIMAGHHITADPRVADA